MPIPIFDPSYERHVQLARLAERAEAVAATIDVSVDGRFETKRRRVREALEADGVSGQIDALVTALLAPAP